MPKGIPAFVCCLIVACLPGCSIICGDECEGNDANGEYLYNNNCARCHGYDAMGGSVGDEQAPAIQGRTVDSIRDAIDNTDEMTFLQESHFNDEQLKAISKYLQELLTVTSSLYTIESLHGRVINDEDNAAQTVTLRDSRGLVLATGTNPQGYYVFNTAGLTPPYLVGTQLADGSVLVSLGLAPGIADISPVTDFIMRNSGNPQVHQLNACLYGNTCSMVITPTQISHGQAVFTRVFTEHLRAAGIAPAQLSPFQTSAGDVDQTQFITDLIGKRTPGCDNPMNPFGLPYDDDTNGDCYLDSDLDFDGFADSSTDANGIPG